MAIRVFVDGKDGTTGLLVHQLLETRGDVRLISIAPGLRKDEGERKRLMNKADVVILCLPDEESRKAIGLVDNSRTCVIDTSSAFRTDPGWVYGLPELGKGQRALIKASKRITNPGCHALAFILAVKPLVEAGIIKQNDPVSSFSITGYSGGGKAMIASYEAPDLDIPATPQPYGLNLDHKHLPEMTLFSGLKVPPVFIPMIGSFYQGLSVWIPIQKPGSSPEALLRIYENNYSKESFVRVQHPSKSGIKVDYFFDISGSFQTNYIDLMVMGNDQRQCVVARIDNLWKGAAGSVVQNMNIHMGIDQEYGLG